MVSVRLLAAFLLWVWMMSRAAADIVTDILSTFVDMREIATDAKTMLELSDQIKHNNTDTTGSTFDNTFPLSRPELGLLLQIYHKCGTNESLALRTWCTGAPWNGSFIGGVQLCPPGIRTHPCSGRVLDVNESVIQYLWPWQGVKCDVFTDPTTVTHIYLSRQRLKCRLQDLDFSHMVSLEQLDLSYNELHGPFPHWLGNMTVLRFLNLRENELWGKVPLSFGDNIAIEVIDFGRNRLVASSLSFFKVFKRLRYLDLAENHFNLSLPLGFFSSDFFEHINLSHNALHGPIPPLPPFNHLAVFDISNNAFEGTLPGGMSHWGKTDPDDPMEKSLLEVIDISNNRLGGSIPPVVNQTSLRHFAIQNNRFEGVFPVLPPLLRVKDASDLFAGNDFLCPFSNITLLQNTSKKITCRCGDGRELIDKKTSYARIPVKTALAICQLCRPGSYSNESSHQKCVQCPQGHVTNTSIAGASWCYPCQKGSFSSVSGGVKCSLCPIGTFADSLGQASCKLCYPGEYADEEGATTCKLCHPGTAAPKLGSSECSKCKPGTFAESNGEISCLPCPRGRYQDNEGGTLCIPCPEGHIAQHRGHTKCVPCPPGMYFDSSKRTCRKCQPNTFTNSSAQTRCLACGKGTVAEGFGNTLCVQPTRAGFGREISVNGSAVSEECQPGYFNNGNYIRCQACPPGSFAPGRRGTQCSLCPPGAYASRSAASMCTPVPIGSYADGEGSMWPKRCPSGSHAENTGSTTCQSCRDNQSSIFGGRGHCESLLDGEIPQQVAWPQADWKVIGMRTAHLLANESLRRELAELFGLALLANGVSGVTPHVLDVVPDGMRDRATVRVVFEILPPKRPTRRESQRDTLTKLRDTYEDTVGVFREVKDATQLWLDRVVGKTSGDDVRLRHANLTDVLPQKTFRNALAYQMGRSSVDEVRAAATLFQVSLLSTAFNGTRAIKCPLGSYFTKDITSGQRDCILCPNGTYADKEGLVGACKPCPIRHYADQQGLDCCFECPWDEGAMPGSSHCERCGFFSRACGGFWNNVLITVILATVVSVKVWLRAREMWSGRRELQEETERAALVASIRSFGRVPWASTSAPCGRDAL